MKTRCFFLLLFFIQHNLIAQHLTVHNEPLPDAVPAKSRVFVLTDISNEPDDEESLVRFLVYANQFDTEGLVATTSMYLKQKPREDLIRIAIEAYVKVQPNLSVHQPGFPDKKELLAVTTTGQSGFGMSAVGQGKSTAGSKLLEKALTKNDPRPLWISAWGGVNTLAQALIDLQKNVSEKDFKNALAKARVYAISDQDDAGIWLRNKFPELFYIVSPAIDYNEYYKATWTGISGDKFYANGPAYHFDVVENAWLKTNVIENHGPLGALYPAYLYIMEGDTPSFLGLVNNGMGSVASPYYGGWGGRYVFYQSYAETRPIWTNNKFSRDEVTTEQGTTVSDMATIWRWRQHYQHDFAARMDWCVNSSFEKANHNPVAILNGDNSKQIITLSAKPGSEVNLSSEGSSDPDNNQLQISWLIYKEAGTYAGEAKLSASKENAVKLIVPDVKNTGSIHVILQVTDNGTPGLTSYRRAIINVVP